MADENQAPSNQNQTVNTPAPAAQAVPAGAPDTWPGAFGIYKNSKAAVMRNLVTIIVIWLISIFVSAILNGILKKPGELISFIVGSLFAAAYTITYIESVRGNKIEVGESINRALPLWLNMFLLSLLICLASIVSFLLLVVPFFFVFPRLILGPYYLVDKKTGVMDAFQASWDNTKGHVGKVYGIIGAIIAMGLLMITIIGIPFSLYFLIMYSAAYAILYEYIQKHPSAAPAAAKPSEPVPAPPAT